MRETEYAADVVAKATLALRPNELPGGKFASRRTRVTYASSGDISAFKYLPSGNDDHV